MTRFYLKNTIFSPATAVGILGLWLGMLLGTDFYTDLTYCFQYAISIGVTTFFIPVASILPICYLQRQMNAGHARDLCMIRSSRNAFSWGALIAAVLSGMVVMLGALLAFTAFSVVYNLLVWGTPYFGEGLFVYSGEFYHFLSVHPVLIYFFQGGVFVLNGVIWPAVALMCFSFTSNSYITLAVPFVVRTALGWMTQTTPLYFLDPGQLMLGGGGMTGTVGGGIPYLLAYCATVIILCGIVWRYSLERRLQDGGN